MSNHIHLALIAGAARLASWIGAAHGPFAEWINERHNRIGSVFVRGPKSIGMRADGVARLVAYIHRNPVRAGIVARANESSWTSHHAYLQPATAPAWLDVARGLELMRFADANAMDAWVDATPIERLELDTLRLDPINRGGRPPFGRAAEVGNLAAPISGLQLVPAPFIT
ncbi:MAG: transposase [Kofleriaceae bacterium]